MASSEILREFLVAIGYKNDEVAQKKLVDGIAKLSKDFLGFAVAAEGAALAVVGALGVMAKSFENAYFQSQRTNSSIREMKSFAFAASQMGSSVEEATSAVETLALKVRENPGFGSLIKGITKDNSNDWTKQLVELGDKFAHMSSAQAHAYAGVMGIPEHLLLALERTSEFRAQMAGADSKYGILGFDPEKAGADGQKLTQAFRGLYDTFTKIGEKTGSGLFRDLEPQIKRLNDFLLAHGKELSDMLIKIGDALFKMFDYVVRHLPEIDHFVEAIGGWTVAMTGLSAVMTATFVARVAGLLTSLVGISRVAMPAWLLGMMGLPAVVAGEGAALAYFGTAPYNNPENQRGTGMVGMRKHQADRDEDAGGPLSTVKRAWKNRPGILGGGGHQSGRVAKGGWWTPERQKQAYDYLTSQGVSSLGAAALVSRWKNVESTKDGADAVNSIGMRGIAQMDHHRWGKVGGSKGFEDQLAAVAAELRGEEGHAAAILNSAKSAAEAARGASAYERAEGWNGRTDNYAGTTEAGIGEILRNAGITPSMSPKVPPTVAAPGTALPEVHLREPLLPGYKAASPYGRLNTNALHSLFNAPPLGTGSSNDNSRNMSINHAPHITVNGVSDPTAAAAQVGARMDRQYGTLLKNMQSAIG